MDCEDYTFSVQTKMAGQQRKYGGCHYHYFVSSPNCGAELVKEFCTKVLHPAIPKDKMTNPFQCHIKLLEVRESRVWDREKRGFTGRTVVEYKAYSESTH